MVLTMMSRIEEDATRRETLIPARESDFGFQVPVDADQTTFMMAVEGQSSPARPLPEITDEQPSINIGPLPGDQPPPAFGDFEDYGPAYDLRSSSPEDYGPPAPEDGMDLTGVDADATEEEGGEASVHLEQRRKQLSKKGLKLSRYGVEYPSLPPAVVKRLAGTFAKSSGITKTKISPEALAEIQRASDWFFEQLGDDLSAYAKHAKRKTIDESDMLTLMRRYVAHEEKHGGPRFGYLLFFLLHRFYMCGADILHLQTTPDQLDNYALLPGAETSAPGAVAGVENAQAVTAR